MNEQHLYLAACAKDGGIYHYVKTADGALRFCEKTPLDRPTYLAIEGNRLYALLRGTDPSAPDDLNSGLISYELDEHGTPCRSSAVESSLGQCACHLEVDNGIVYAVNYVSGSVIRFPDTLITHIGHGVHPTRQEAPHTHFVKRTPDGAYLFVVDLGLDTIFTYDRSLCPVSAAKVPEGSGCRHLAYSADGHTVFCANELTSTVSVFGYADGVLTLKNTYSALPEDFDGQSTAAAIRVVGDQLYVSNRGHDSITRFRIAGDTLVWQECTPCGGKSPRDFDLFGELLVCTNESSDSVTLFRLENGRPVLLPMVLPMAHPLCVIAKEGCV